MYVDILHLHPRAIHLWIDAAGFEFFESGGDVNMMEEARVLIERGIMLDPLSKELWLQYVALELHYWIKLVGCAILKLHLWPNISMPANIVLRNAIRETPYNANFRLKFLRICEIFPFDFAKGIEDGINDGIFNNFKNNVDA